MYPRCRIILVAVASLSGVCAWVACNSSALAVTTFWNTISSGNFNDGGNWDNGVPGMGDTAIFREGIGATYTVTFDGSPTPTAIANYFSDRLIVGNNDVTFQTNLFGADYRILNATTAESGRGIIVGELGGVVLDTATLTTTFPVLGVAATIADAPETTGTVNVNSAMFDLSGDSETDHEFIVANHGTGTLNVTNGADVSLNGTSGDSIIGNHSDSDGAANITGAGSTWTNGSTLVVGADGTGALTIADGGNVSDHGATIGQATNSHGSATITGVGSSWNHNNRSLVVGGDGEGTLTISNGGTVSNSFGFVGDGDFENAGGSATVTGAGSTWNNGPFFAVAQFGHGTMTIEDGGIVSSNIGFIGTQLDSNGTVTVTGTDSTWSTSVNCVVGFQGMAELHVLDGGSVSSNNTWLAGATTSTSTATISGAGSTWTIAGRLAISEAFDPVELGPGGGTGTLTIQPGATVSVAQETALFPGGTLNLEGGTLDAQSIVFQGGGTFDWTSGTLHVGTFDGNLVNQGGSFAPGHSAGTTMINGDYAQQAGAILDIEIGGLAPGTEHDVVDIAGSALVDGELEIALISDFLPEASDSFTILTAATGISGAFANVANGQRLTTIDGFGSFLAHYGGASTLDPNQLILDAFQAVPLPGDYNQNGSVDAADYIIWRRTLGQSGIGLAADGNGNKQIDNGDYNIWRSHFGQSVASEFLAHTAVPEPANFILLTLAATGWCLRRSRAG